MNIYAQTIRSPLNEPAAHASGAGSAVAGAAAGFASLLQQAAPAPMPVPASAAPPTAQAPQPRPAERAAPPAHATPAASTPACDDEPDAPVARPEAPADSAAAARRNAQLAARSRIGGSAPSGSREPVSNATSVEPDPVARAADAATEARGDQASTPPPVVVPIDPSILQWLAGLQRGGPPHAADATSVDDGVDATTTDAAQAPAGAAHDRPATELKAEVDAKSRSAADTASLATPLGGSPFASLEARSSGASAATRTQLAPAAVGAAAFVPAVSAGTNPAAPVAVGIATPVTTPEFAQALGLQMSVLTRDGVQHAELHLNPAEMGPVSVQIVMDGTQARVDFGADLAQTRRAIEAGLPELASALRDAGFTLAGGGVSQHARSRHGAEDGGRGHDERRRPAPGLDAGDAVSRVGSVARRIVSAGGVDLFV